MFVAISVNFFFINEFNYKILCNFFFQPEGKEHRKSQSFILDPNGNTLTLSPGQTGNVLRPNTMKHCLVNQTVYLLVTLFGAV